MNTIAPRNSANVVLTFALSLFATWIVPGSLDAATPVVCGDNLSTAGGQYTLTSDVICSNNPAITISAANVSLTLAGHTLTGPGAGTSTGIGILIAAVPGVHVNGGTVTGFLIGIDLDGSTDAHVNGMTIIGNVTGVALLSANGNHINGNNISNNTQLGVLLQNSATNAFNTNVISGNGQNQVDGGIALYSSSYNLITSNTLADDGLVGVFIDPLSTYNTVKSCIASTSNPGQLPSPNRTGILVAGSNNLIQGNTTNYNQYGIWLTGPSSKNTIQSNVAIGNWQTDLRDDTTCNNNKWKSNTFVTASPANVCIQ
jgi:parallel beta-helix repeat protein